MKTILTAPVCPLITKQWQCANVSVLSVRFAKALAGGRRLPPPKDTRERVLVTLLRKRAAAQVAGADELEDLLRAQIRWSLPTVAPEDEPREAA